MHLFFLLLLLFGDVRCGKGVEELEVDSLLLVGSTLLSACSI
jgi:hypothetical protein